MRETEIYSAWLERASGLPAVLTAFGFITQTAPAYGNPDTRHSDVPQPTTSTVAPDDIHPVQTIAHGGSAMAQHNCHSDMESERATPQFRAPHGNGMAVAGLVLGITSIVFSWCGLLSLAQIVLAIVFSSSGIRQADRGAGRRGMAIAGLATGITGALAYLTIGIASMGTGFLI